jgi:hypothetical protein
LAFCSLCGGFWQETVRGEERTGYKDRKTTNFDGEREERGVKERRLKSG